MWCIMEVIKGKVSLNFQLLQVNKFINYRMWCGATSWMHPQTSAWNMCFKLNLFVGKSCATIQIEEASTQHHPKKKKNSSTSDSSFTVDTSVMHPQSDRWKTLWKACALASRVQSLTYHILVACKSPGAARIRLSSHFLVQAASVCHKHAPVCVETSLISAVCIKLLHTTPLGEGMCRGAPSYLSELQKHELDTQWGYFIKKCMWFVLSNSCEPWTFSLKVSLALKKLQWEEEQYVQSSGSDGF